LKLSKIDIGSGQVAPGNVADEDSAIRYKIIDRVDARYMERSIVKESSLKKLVFIQNKQNSNDVAAMLLVDQDIFYEISTTPNFRNAIWISAGNLNFDSDGGGRNALNDFRAWLKNVNIDLIKTAEYWLMEEKLFDDVYKVLLVPVITLESPDVTTPTYKRFELWRSGNKPYVS
jgi:ribulose bisphosphate carboxylase small subunit